MEKTIKTYCPKCGCETAHRVYTEDGMGVSGVGRIFSTLLTAGTSLLFCKTYCTCLSCGKTREV